MTRIQRMLAAAAVAVMGAAAGAPAAEAQITPRPLIELKTQGGRVLFNFDMKIYATGFTVATMKSPRNPGEVLYLYDYMDRGQVASLVHQLDAVRFRSLPPVLRSRAMIADLPDHVITFRGKSVRYSTMAPPRTPIASPSFIAVMGNIGSEFARIAEEPLVTYHKRGGSHGAIDQTLDISRSGHAKLAGSFLGNPNPDKELGLDFAKVNALKRAILAAGWFGLPASYPQVVIPPDAYFFSVGVSDPTDKVKTVTWATMSQPPARVLAVQAQLDRMVAEVNR